MPDTGDTTGQETKGESEAGEVIIPTCLSCTEVVNTVVGKASYMYSLYL